MHTVYGLSSKPASLTQPLLSLWRLLGFFRDPDLIIVLKDGAVVEQGTHEELMLARGLYYSMWQEQAADTFSESFPAVVE